MWQALSKIADGTAAAHRAEIGVKTDPAASNARDATSNAHNAINAVKLRMNGLMNTRIDGLGSIAGAALPGWKAGSRSLLRHRGSLTWGWQGYIGPKANVQCPTSKVGGRTDRPCRSDARSPSPQGSDAPSEIGAPMWRAGRQACSFMFVYVRLCSLNGKKCSGRRIGKMAKGRPRAAGTVTEQ